MIKQLFQWGLVNRSGKALSNRKRHARLGRA